MSSEDSIIIGIMEHLCLGTQNRESYEASISFSAA
jgi:hypothetical protein